MKLLLVLYLLTRDVAAVIQSVTWKEVLVSQSLVSFPVTLPVSAVRTGNICDATDKCLLVCAVEGGYGLSEEEFESEYYEKAEGDKYKCWTKMTMKHTPLKLQQDGLYYHADFARSYKMNGAYCIMACRRIPGYRLAIARTDDQFRAISEVYDKPHLSQGEGSHIYTGLAKHEKDGGVVYKWVDGTAYSLTVTMVIHHALDKHFLVLNGKLNDWGGDGNCLCQGNPSLLNW